MWHPLEEVISYIEELLLFLLLYSTTIKSQYTTLEESKK